jgi:DNA-binding GntR family transcriptional regulator
MSVPIPETHLERTLAGQVYHAIRQALLNGSLALGGKLSEREIADSLRVSRTPVREALRQLERDGLVINEPQRGTFVRTFSPQEAFEVYDLRALLESYAVRRMAETASEADLGDLRAAIEGGRAAVDSRHLGDAMTSNDAFHSTLIRLARHDLLLAEWRRVWSAVVLLRSCGWHHNAWRPVEAVPEHQTIYEALVAGDGEEAARLVDQHIRRAWHEVEGYLAAQARS